MPQQESPISWNVLSHEHRERTADWYWTLGTLAVVGAVVSIFFSNILLACILLIGAGSIGFLAARGPREHAVRIDEKGIHIDGTVYPYKSLESFSIHEDTTPPYLVLSIHSFITPRLLLSLEGMSAETVRDRLSLQVKEIESQPHLMDSLAEIFGL